MGKRSPRKNQGTGKNKKIKEQGGTLMEVRALTQSEQKCAALIKVMELKNKLTDMEMQSVYFRGCYDSVGYLKKAGIL